MNRKVLMTVALVSALAGVVWLVKPKYLSDSGPGAAARAKGNANAPLRIVEHADFQCHSCAESAMLMKSYFYTYPSEIRLEFHYHPFPDQHPNALTSAVYAECAAQQRQFWPFAESLFEDQSEWAPLQDPSGFFHTIAANLSLDTAKLDACVADPATQQTVLRDKQEGESQGVKVTPTFFINGKRTVGTEAMVQELGAYFAKKAKSGH